MNTTKRIPLMMAGGFAIAIVSTPVTAGPWHSGCYTGGACHQPVGFYTIHEAYPGLNTYHGYPTNPNNPGSQAQYPLGYKLKPTHRR
jgi:hypothetical protein